MDDIEAGEGIVFLLLIAVIGFVVYRAVSNPAATGAAVGQAVGGAAKGVVYGGVNAASGVLGLPTTDQVTDDPAVARQILDTQGVIATSNGATPGAFASAVWGKLTGRPGSPDETTTTSPTTDANYDFGISGSGW